MQGPCCFGRVTTANRISTPSALFLFFVTLECFAIVSLCICDIIYLIHHDEFENSRYVIVVGLSTAFLSWFAYDAVWKESVFQFCAFLAVSTFMLMRVFWSYYNPDVLRSREIGDIYWACLIGACVFQSIYLVLGHRVYNSFGWRLYKKVGADPRLIAMYKKYEAFRSLLFVDLQFGITISTLALFLNWTGQDEVVLALTLSNLVLSALLIPLALMAVQSERSGFMALFFVTSTLFPAFMAFICYTLFTDRFEDDTNYERANFLTMGSLAVICRALLIVSGISVYKNFDEGLKDQVFDKSYMYPTLPRTEWYLDPTDMGRAKFSSRYPQHSPPTPNPQHPVDLESPADSAPLEHQGLLHHTYAPHPPSHPHAHLSSASSSASSSNLPHVGHSSDSVGQGHLGTSGRDHRPAGPPPQPPQAHGQALHPSDSSEIIPTPRTKKKKQHRTRHNS
eukprot:TRINITY_DN19220_c0_g1::TRINITY_DN19220_c0_g1_i1::g.2229::m.2229 TRINITY_DN19220_c0_g1::TRINITY_DN19220_c0_g1_i1::g.2229  ORF type:complete len:451 (-),score=26.45 TRINITY_DN19220_c0_g1_i1:151-1503(-)